LYPARFYRLVLFKGRAYPNIGTLQGVPLSKLGPYSQILGKLRKICQGQTKVELKRYCLWNCQ
jgi:hypothetical protein